MSLALNTNVHTGYFLPRRLIVHLCVTKELKNTSESLLLSNVNVRVPNTKHNPQKTDGGWPFPSTVFDCKQTNATTLTMFNHQRNHHRVLGAGGGQIRPSPPKSDISRTFANHVHTFCYATSQVRRAGSSAIDPPQHHAGASPPVTMLVKGGTG